ncbi:MAG: lipoprotein [Woeseia sp.]
MFHPFPVLAACLLLVAGCGQKGPLVLPGDPSEMQTEIPAIEPGTLPGDDDADDEPDDEADNSQPDDESN